MPAGALLTLLRDRQHERRCRRRVPGPVGNAAKSAGELVDQRRRRAIASPDRPHGVSRRAGSITAARRDGRRRNPVADSKRARIAVRVEEIDERERKILRVGDERRSTAANTSASVVAPRESRRQLAQQRQAPLADHALRLFGDDAEHAARSRPSSSVTGLYEKVW